MKVPVQVVKKALDTLDYVLEKSFSGQGVALSDISEFLDSQPTTTRNLLKTMETCGYLGRTGRSLYSPGPKCRDLLRSTRLTRLNAMQHMPGIVQRLGRTLGEAAVLTTMLHGRRRVLCRVESSNLIQVNMQATEQLGIYGMVTGRVLLAFSEPDELKAAISIHGMPGMDWPEIISKEDLQSALAIIRSQSLAEDIIDNSLASFAVPVLTGNGELLGALGTHLPLFRYEKEKRNWIISQLNDAAKSISEEIEENYSKPEEGTLLN